MEYLNQRLVPQTWDVYIQGRCNMTGCYEYADGLCSEHQMVVDSVVQDMIDMNIKSKIYYFLRHLVNSQAGQRYIFYIDDNPFYVTSSYEMILKLIDVGVINLRTYSYEDMLKFGKIYNIPNADLTDLAITSLQRYVKRLYLRQRISF